MTDATDKIPTPAEALGRTDGHMGFAQVLSELVSQGSKPAGSPSPRFARHGWNGKGLHIEAQWPDEHSKMTKPYLFMQTPDGSRIPWVPSSGDLFAADWYLLP